MVVKQKQISRTSWSINKTKMRDNYLEPKIKRKMIARKKNYFEVKTTSGSSKKRKTARKAKQPKLETKNHGHMEPIFVWKSQSLRRWRSPLQTSNAPRETCQDLCTQKRKSWNVTFTVTAVQICKANNFLITRVTKTYVKTKDKK